MTQEPKAMPGPGKQSNPKSAPTNDDEIAEVEIVELQIPANNGIFNKIQMVFEKFASNRVGQMFYEQCDRVLKVVEDTARWRLPQDDNDVKLERPLPWVFFLSLIIWLRVLHFWLNVGSAIVGTPRVTPQSMVYSIQIKRRRLRAIRVRGLKALRRQEHDSSAMSTSSGKPPSLMVKVRQLFGSAVCRPGLLRDVPARRVFAQGDNAKKALDENSSERCTTKRARDDDSVDLNLTVDQMLDKYANDDSDDDSDYMPNVEDDDDNSTSTSSMSSEEEMEKESVEKLPEPSKATPKNNLDQSLVEIKENGGPKHRPVPKPLVDIKLEPISDADSGNEQIKTPREPEDTGKFDNHYSGKQTTEVDPKQPHEQLNTPPQHQLSVTLDEGALKKSTPGHETAATLKPILGVTTIAGSPQDFHSIFHPAPLIKVHPLEVHSTPKEDNDDSAISTPETPEWNKPHQRKATQPNQNKQSQLHNFHNKNRNKNRR